MILSSSSFFSELSLVKICPFWPPNSAWFCPQHPRFLSDFISALSSLPLWGLSLVGTSEGPLYFCCSRAQLPCSMWNPPRPGIQLASPALQGGFLTTGPPGKPPSRLFYIVCPQIHSFLTCLSGHVFGFLLAFSFAVIFLSSSSG